MIDVDERISRGSMFRSAGRGLEAAHEFSACDPDQPTDHHACELQQKRDAASGVGGDRIAFQKVRETSDPELKSNMTVVSRSDNLPTHRKVHPERVSQVTAGYVLRGLHDLVSAVKLTRSITIREKDQGGRCGQEAVLYDCRDEFDRGTTGARNLGSTRRQARYGVGERPEERAYGAASGDG